MRGWLCCSLGALLVACTTKTPSGVGGAEARAQTRAAHAVASAAPGSSVEPKAASAKSSALVHWADLVRAFEWQKASSHIDSLSEAERARADVRFARARVALELDDHACAMRELEGLDDKLPHLRDDVQRARALAALHVGPFPRAAEYFSQRSDAESWLHAAEAFVKAGDVAKARQMADRVLAKSRDDDLKVRARAFRAELSAEHGPKQLAVADLRWLAIHAPTASHAEGAPDRLAELSAPSALTAKERYERALEFARAGDVEAVEAELAAAKGARGPKLSAAERSHALGWAYYMSRSDYAKAAELLHEASKLGGKHPIKDLFYSARAKSRAHDDDAAIDLYDGLAKRFPKTSFAQQARYLAARLEYIRGNWKAAVNRFNEYQRRYGQRGAYAESVRYSLTISQLAAGDYKNAATGLSRLVDQEKNPRYRARYEELQGVALLGLNKKEEAKKLFEKVIDERPLSLSALFAAERLRQMQHTPPPPIQPGQASAPTAPLKIELPQDVRALMHMGLDADAEGALREHESALRKRYGSHGWRALCTAYGGLSVAERRYVVGQTAVNWQPLSRAPSSETRWMWECIYPRPHADVVEQVEAEHELPKHLVYAVMRQESAFRPLVVSPAKAVGLMQMIPPTAKRVADELGVEYDPSLLRVPAHNVRFGAHYLKKLLGMFGGNVALTAAAYNAGPQTVSRWLESGEKLPLDVFVARIPYDETRGYVYRVVGNLARYGYLEEGPGGVPSIELEIQDGLRAPPDAY